MSQYTFPKVNFANANPTVNSDSTKGYIKGCLLINEATGDAFRCLSDTTGAARWLKLVEYLDPLEASVASYQTEINNGYAAGDVFITPQIYHQKNTVDYDVTIPGNAMSSGPITIALGKTVTVGANGVWTIV